MPTRLCIKRNSKAAAHSTSTKPLELIRPISFHNEQALPTLQVRTGDTFWLLSDFASYLLRTDSPIAGLVDIQDHHLPMSPNGWSVTIKVPRGLGVRIFEVSSASRPGVGWQSGVITIPQC